MKKQSTQLAQEYNGPKRITVMADAKFGQLAANDVGDEKDIVPFTGVAYAGGVVKLGYFGKIIVDLASFKTQSKTPMLFHHDGKKIVGHGKVNIEDGKLTVEGFVYNDDKSPEGQSIVSKFRKGFPWKLSIGWIWETRQFLSKGVKAKVNGKTVSGPITILSGNVLDEISFTGIPADRNTKVKIAASSDQSTVFYMEEENSIQLKNGDIEKMEFTQEEKDTLTKELADSKAKVVTLEGQLSTNGSELTKLKETVTDLKADGRKEKLKALDGKLSEDDTAKLLKLDDDSFDFMVGKLSVKTKLPKDLTNHLAEGDDGEGDDDGDPDGGPGKASIDLVGMAKERNKVAMAS